MNLTREDKLLIFLTKKAKEIAINQYGDDDSRSHERENIEMIVSGMLWTINNLNTIEHESK